MSHTARAVFLGTGPFAVPVVDALFEHAAAELVGVVTAPTRIGSRGKPTDPPVALWAAEHGVVMLRPDRLRADASLARIRELDPDLLVLADYGQIVPAALLDLPRHGSLNLHPSLLPRHRGATPIPAAILAGDAQTGVSLMRMDAGLDTGPIVAQSLVEIGPNETAPQLESRLATEAARLLGATLEHWLAGEITPDPQQESSATQTRPLRRADGLLDPTKTAAELARQVRAYQPWPSSFLETNAGRLIVWQAAELGELDPHPTGLIFPSSEGRLVLTAADGFLDLVEVQLAGGRRMSGIELARGHPGVSGHVLPAEAET